jgi:hypothetical protein
MFYVFTSPGAPTSAVGSRSGEPDGSCGTQRRSLDLDQSWTLDVPGEPSRTLASLVSWHEQPDLRFHSGVVTYRRDVEVPEAATTTACPVWLDFGEGTPRAEEPLTNGMRAWLDAPVREAAVVHVNGRRAGSVWCPPYALDVTGFFREGPNALRIEVGNLAINHMAGRALPDYRLLNLRYGVRFEPQDMKDLEPLPSGLLQAVRLAPVGFEP